MDQLILLFVIVMFIAVISINLNKNNEPFD